MAVTAPGAGQPARRRSTAVLQDAVLQDNGPDLGNLKPGLSLDNVAELIEQVEGTLHR